MNPVFAELPTTVFETMSRLAREHGAVNLGQGFPDDPGPADIREAGARALIDGPNQYPPMMGLPALRTAIAAHYARHQGLALDPETEVMVTSGATEALAGALLALIEPGDEVVLFAPMYDAYLPLVRRAGGVARIVNLTPPAFRLDEAALAAAFSDRTKLVLLNNPLNPAATLFGQEDLALLARFCCRHDVIALCDEVWEHVVFDGARHVPLMALPGMRERTVKIGSAGKIFSLTGWKVGFVTADARLMRVLAKAHQFLTFTTPPNLQAAVALGLGKEDPWFAAMRAGVPSQRIFIERSGVSSDQSMRTVRRLMDARQLRTALLVSDPFHMLRLHILAARLGIRAYSSPSSARRPAPRARRRPPRARCRSRSSCLMASSARGSSPTPSRGSAAPRRAPRGTAPRSCVASA